MHRILHKTTRMTALEPWKWLKGMDKAGMLNLLWVSHYNRTPITLLVIKQLLCLVHDGCLWLEEPIPITDRLIHRITRLPYSRENPAVMFGGKVGELALAEAMKKKFGLVKMSCGYAITSISDPTVKVATYILVGKVMRKCHSDEVPMLIMALTTQCMEGVQFS